MESSADQGLSAGCNLVLGKNGSGKSSFLTAILYVLSDRFNGISKQQKRSMLNNIAQQASSTQQRQRAAARAQNEGPAGAVKHNIDQTHTYWVEVTLDNSQNRIPFRANELTVRKSYNCNTDREEYHLNGQ
jgi:chromosome segregation ATPase